MVDTDCQWMYNFFLNYSLIKSDKKNTRAFNDIQKCRPAMDDI